MAIAVTDLAAWATTTANVQSVTSNTFSVDAGDLIILCAAGDDNSSEPAEQPFSDTVTDSATPDLTWTVITSSGASGSGFMKAWWAIAGQAYTNITATVSKANQTSGPLIGVKPYKVTGHHTVTPIGATWNTSNTSTTNNWSPNTYTSTANNSRGFAIGTDWAALGAPTSTDVESAGHDATSISWLSAYKETDTAISGTVVTFNFDAAAGTPDWRAITFEVVPAAVAGVSIPGRRIYVMP